MKNCSICHEDVEEDKVKFLNCMHYFCLDCYNKFETHNIINCPMCRTSISTITNQVKHNNTPTEPSILENISSSYLTNNSYNIQLLISNTHREFYINEPEEHDEEYDETNSESSDEEGFNTEDEYGGYNTSDEEDN